MSRTPQQISSDILAKLGVTDPGLSLEVGTPERHIVDAVSESIAECYIDNYLMGSANDINTKSGTDLEQYVGVFGFGRLAGRASTGSVQFSLGYVATQDIQIPLGSQIYSPATQSGSGTDLYFNTLQVGVVSQGTQSCTVPAQCTVVGVLGNVSSNTVTGFGPGSGIAIVTNNAPFTGGLDPETDDQLRARFKSTFLRNIAGTEDFYKALCLNNIYTSKVAVLGPISKYREEIQFSGSNKVYSTNPDVKYTWPNGWFIFRDQGLPTEVFYTPASDYAVDTTVTPPGVTPFHPDLTATNATANFEYEYTSIKSRNDPANGIANKVDIFMDGVQSVSSTEYTSASTITLNSTYGSMYNVNNFIREDGTACVAGHTFQPLGSVPIVAFPSQITAGSTVYVKGTHYLGIKDNTLNQGSSIALSGLEWITSPPNPGTLLTITFSYNRLPEMMGSLLSTSKQITTDVLVHQARYRNLYVYAKIAYDYQVNITQVNANINTALTTFFTGLGFGAWIQFSDVAQAIHAVSGVDNVKIARATDVGAVNLSPNPTFTNGTTGWSGLNSATLGTASGGTTGTYLTAKSTQNTTATGAITAALITGLSASQVYKFSCDVIPPATSTVTLSVDWYNASGTKLSTSTQAFTSTPSGIFTSVSNNFTVPANATQANIYVDGGVMSVNSILGIANTLFTLTPLNYGIASRLNGNVVNDYIADFKLDDDELAAYDGISILRKSPNSFGV